MKTITIRIHWHSVWWQFFNLTIPHSNESSNSTFKTRNWHWGMVELELAFVHAREVFRWFLGGDGVCGYKIAGWMDFLPQKCCSTFGSPMMLLTGGLNSSSNSKVFRLSQSRAWAHHDGWEALGNSENWHVLGESRQRPQKWRLTFECQVRKTAFRRVLKLQ